MRDKRGCYLIFLKSFLAMVYCIAVFLDFDRRLVLETKYNVSETGFSSVLSWNGG
jgi:hypothetical protein